MFHVWRDVFRQVHDKVHSDSPSLFSTWFGTSNCHCKWNLYFYSRCSRNGDSFYCLALYLGKRTMHLPLPGVLSASIHILLVKSVKFAVENAITHDVHLVAGYPLSLQAQEGNCRCLRLPVGPTSELTFKMPRLRQICTIIWCFVV